MRNEASEWLQRVACRRCQPFAVHGAVCKMAAMLDAAVMGLRVSVGFAIKHVPSGVRWVPRDSDKDTFQFISALAKYSAVNMHFEYYYRTDEPLQSAYTLSVYNMSCEEVSTKSRA
jgi:hypothetical protein